MRIVKRVLSTYSADNFGVCSALYELGGLVVMHDASGCNSTYNTHDEPRWYDTDSLVFVSGLTEKNAIFGNDDRLIQDLVTAAGEFHPNFIAVCGGPLPHIIGTDFRAVAKAVERKCKIPTFGFQTNGMDSYISGAGMALEALVGMMEDSRCSESGNRRGRIKVNILGLTPLDFSLNGSAEALKKLLEREGLSVRSTWAMGDTLENMLSSSDADVNLVVSAVGLKAAAEMERRFGIPFVVGLPAGRKVTEKVIGKIRECADPARNSSREGKGTQETCDHRGIADCPDRHSEEPGREHYDILIIGEPVQSLSVRETIESTYGSRSIRIISPMHGLSKEIIDLGCEKIELEDALADACRRAGKVIADPLYARLLPDEPEKFVALPHVAYSGRYYEDEVPVLAGDGLDRWLAGKLP